MPKDTPRPGAEEPSHSHQRAGKCGEGWSGNVVRKSSNESLPFFLFLSRFWPLGL